MLISRLRAEDPQAVRDFVRRMTPVLRRSGRRLGLEPSRIPDLIVTVLDDVMLHLMRSEEFSPEDLESYTVIAFRNAARDAARAAGTRPEGTEVSLEAAAAIPAANADDDAREDAQDAIAELFRALYRRVIAALPAEERELLGYMVNRAKARTVAAAMGISVPAARVRAYRLRHRLRAAILDSVRTLPEDQRTAVEQMLRRRGLTSTHSDPASQSGVAADRLKEGA